MEVREFAEQVLYGATLDDKLMRAPREPSDARPGDGVARPAPGREARLGIQTDPRRKRKLPSPEGFHDPAQRARILHGVANHELQAIELFAWALLRFPDAPPAFRSGLLRILGEEQDHLAAYLERLSGLGTAFGDHPLSGYFWTRARSIDSALSFLCAMCLTFENANLDHALALADAADAAGDSLSARTLRAVHDAEIGHVRFGLHWLGRFKPEHRSLAQAWLDNLTFPLRPELARGVVFRQESRRAAGFDDEFIGLLEGAERPRALYRFTKT